MRLPDLPILEALPELRSALAGPGGAVLVAPPGAGKSTVVPPALLEEAWLAGRKILMLESRRLAARAVARRIAFLLGEGGVGGTVGYRMRGDTRVGPKTRIEVVTEGILTRMLQSDPALSAVGVVIFDEFHERSLPADLGLALALQARELLRPELRILVMSATLEGAPVAELLGGVPVVESHGRIHPVQTRWLARPPEGRIEAVASRTVRRALEETEGDVLVFLPGAGEIRRAQKLLVEGGLPAGTAVRRLHGSLSGEDQDRALAPSPEGERKVVLASAIAETSLTIEGVRVVVDSGWMRVPRFDPGTGMTRLETVRVTRDAADQRRGRAGRLAPGVCYRAWTKGEDRGLVPRRTPELMASDLAPLALDLAVWGAEPGELKWLDPPPEAGFRQARELLHDLEVLDRDGELTGHGRQVAETGLHPRLGHMLVRAREVGDLGTACDLAALLQERDPFLAEGRAPDADLRARVEALVSIRGGGRPRLPAGHRVARGRLAGVRREADRLRTRLGGQGGLQEPPDVSQVGLLTALAYPDRIARRREGERGRFLLRSGRGARFFESQSLEASEWIVPVEVEDRGKEARIFLAAPVEFSDLETHLRSAIQEEEVLAWDEGTERVRAERVRRIGAILHSDSAIHDPDPYRVALALAEGIRGRGLQVLPWGRDQVQLRERMHFLHRLQPEEWPPASEEALLAEMDEWLVPFLGGIRSLAGLKGVALEEALLSRLPHGAHGARADLERLAPSHLEVPSGSRILLDYSDSGAPALAVRLQEVFGLTETPRIGGGRVPVTMRLLSPAQRPVQVTTDLASFWRDAYFEVRKDLRGRYPKHAWPEDPLNAPPTRKTRRRDRG